MRENYDEYKEIIEEQTDKEEEKVIPILSVLSPKEQEYDKDENLQETIEIKDTDEEEIETEEITEEIELDEITTQSRRHDGGTLCRVRA